MDGQRSADSSLCAFTTFQYVSAPATRKARSGSMLNAAGGDASERAASAPAAEVHASDGSAAKPLDWRCGAVLCTAFWKRSLCNKQKQPNDDPVDCCTGSHPLRPHFTATSYSLLYPTQPMCCCER